MVAVGHWRQVVHPQKEGQDDEKRERKEFEKGRSYFRPSYAFRCNMHRALLSHRDAGCADKPFVLKAVTAFDKGNKAHKGIPALIEMVEKEVKGRLKIQWLGGP